MSDKQTYKHIPALRFPDFANDGEWEKDTFENTFLFLPNNTLSRAELNYENGSTKNVHYGDVLIRFGDCLDVQTSVLPFISDEAVADKLQRSRLQNGDIVIADTAEDETVGKCTEIFNMSGENVVSGLHTIPIRPKKQFAIPYLGFYFNSDSYRKQLLPLMQGIKVMSISKTAIGKTIVAYPSLLSEQCKIGLCLFSMDAYISATKEKLELLKTYKESLMQKLFPAKDKNLPELRFKEFEKEMEWEEKKLGEIAVRVTSKNKNNQPLAVLTNSATEGVVNQQDYFDREIVTKDNLTNYNVIEQDDFVYNPRISNAAPVGPISRNKIGKGIMSPLYMIFRFKEGNIDFFEQYFKTKCWHQYLKDKANYGARFDRMNISNEDFLNLPLHYPSPPEQRKIASCLSAMDDQINAYAEKVILLGRYKKGLMQQMFLPSK